MADTASGGGGCFVATAAGPVELAATLWLALLAVVALMGLSRHY